MALNLPNEKEEKEEGKNVIQELMSYYLSQQ